MNTNYSLKPITKSIKFATLGCTFFISGICYATTPLSDSELEANYLPITKKEQAVIKPKNNCDQQKKTSNTSKQNKQTGACGSSDGDGENTNAKNKKEDKEKSSSNGSEDEQIEGTSDNIQKTEEELMANMNLNSNLTNGLSQLENDLALTKAQNDLFKKTEMDKEILRNLTKNPLKTQFGQVQLNKDGTVSITSTEPGEIEFDYIYRSINGGGINKGTDIEIPSIRVGYTELKISTKK